MAQVREQIDTPVNELAELEKEESRLLVSSLSNMEAYFAQQEKALRGMRLARTSGERSAAGSRSLIIWRASTHWHVPAVGQLRRFQTDGSGVSPPSLSGQPDKVILFRHGQRCKLVGYRLLVVADNPCDVEPAQVRQIVSVRRIAHGDDGVDRRGTGSFAMLSKRRRSAGIPDSSHTYNCRA